MSEKAPTSSGGRPYRGGAGLGVVVVDPLPIVSEGLELFLDSQDDFQVLAQANSADQAIERMAGLTRHTNVIVVVALETGGEHDAFWLIRQLREKHPTCVVVACSANSMKTAISRALFAGADGYINKRADPIEFLDSLRRAAQGELVLTGLPPDWFGDIAEGVAKEGEARSLLTERERQILLVAAEGLSAREIAGRLKLAERTVTTHLTNIYGKLGVHGRVAAITAAARAGLVSVELAELGAADDETG
jgi:DNA-binding NarL/FixJ family response regulator